MLFGSHKFSFNQEIVGNGGYHVNTGLTETCDLIAVNTLNNSTGHSQSSLCFKAGKEN